VDPIRSTSAHRDYICRLSPRGAILIKRRLRLVQKLRQLDDIHRDPLRLGCNAELHCAPESVMGILRQCNPTFCAR